MPVKRFDAATWRNSPVSRRRLDLMEYAKERAVVAEICARIAAEGDEALRELGLKFDGWAPAKGEPFEVAPQEMRSAAERLPTTDLEALEFAAARIRDFHEAEVPPMWVGPLGLQLITRPIERGGIYAPGGRAPYPSTVLMTAIPARVAGVPNIALATPPRADGTIPDVILAAAYVADVDVVYRMGGAQAIAAFAYGTQTIPRVDVVAGPGNIFVTLAKREVFGAVGVDGIAGPTEVVIVADAGARADFVAADLAAQLEHDPLAWGVLFTDSAELGDRVEEELASLLRGLDRAEIIRQAKCCIVVVPDIDEAIRLVNEFAPEHLLIVTADAEELASKVRNAGAVFIGPNSTVPLGDYTAGPNHTLPTAGAARFGSPLGVYSFLKRTSVLTMDEHVLAHLREATVRLAHLEGMGAHAHAVEVRLE